MSRVALVEFAATDRFHRKVSFPYVAGWLRGAGVATRWLRFGVAADRQFERGEQGLGLTAGELGTLSAALAEHRPTHLLLGSAPAPGLVEALRAAAPGVRLGLLGEVATGALPPGLEAVDESPGACAAFLGLPEPPPGRPLHRLAPPHFGYEAANDAARASSPLPFVVLGRECTFSLPFSRNAFLAEAGLDDCLRRGGCAFCVRPEETPGAWDLTDDEVAAHLQALYDTVPAAPGRLAVRLVGEPAVARLAHLVDVLLAQGFRDADWLLDARADTLVLRHERLADAATRLRGTGNRLHVALVGIESFSADELARLNKGVDPLTNLDAVRTLLELEARCPDTFSFREHGGLSLILFTPWTTRADLAANLRLLHVTGLAPLCGKVFTSRLRLVPGLPLTARARHDGLLREAYDDPLLDTAARNLYDPELPWRFAAHELEAVCRLMLRFPGTAPADDPLAAPVAAALGEARAAGIADLELALRLVELAEAGEAPLRLLERARAWLSGVQHEHAATRRGERWAAPEASTAEPALPLALAVEQSRLGLKPVSKVEPLSAAQAEALVRGGTLPNAQARRRRVGEAEAPVHEVFFGADQARVSAAVAATDRLEAPPSDDAERQAVAEVGGLLGYPACCAGAFAAARSSGRWSYAWLHLRHRIAAPGEAPWELNPFAASLLTPHVPCSLGCAPTLALARATRGALARVAGDEAAARVEQQARNPWLAVLEGQGAGLELVPEQPPGERFRFRAGACTDPASADLAVAAEGDEVVIEPLRLVVLKAGRPLVELTWKGWIWWTERALQVDAWSRVLALRDRTASGPSPGGRAPDAADEPDVAKASPRLARLRALLLKALPGAGGGVSAGFVVSGPHVVAHGRMRLGFARGAERFALEIEEARPGAPCWLRVGPFALTVPGDGALPEGEALEAVHELVRRLQRVLRAVGERLLRER